MTVQVLPYSVAEFNRIPSLGDSDREFQLRQGEAFVLSTLRLLLLEHKLHHVFGILMLHQHFNLNEDEKLVDFNHQATGWKLKDGSKLMGGRVVPTSWRILKGQGLMPYEFEFRPLSNDTGIDLGEEMLQLFLKDFVSTVESAALHDAIALTLRSETPLGIEIPQGNTNIFFPEGTHAPEEAKQSLKGSWFFNPKPQQPVSVTGKEPGERKTCTDSFAENGKSHPVGPGLSKNMDMFMDTSTPLDQREVLFGWCNVDVTCAHQDKKSAIRVNVS